MEIRILSELPRYLPVIAQWYYNEWGYLDEIVTVEGEIEKLKGYLNNDKIPLILIALEQETIIGAVQLKFYEMNIFPEKRHWLGGVYVAKEHRGKGVARQLVLKAIEKAQLLKVGKLFLQTENLTGGLYKKLGWEPLEKVNYNHVDVLVMERNL